MPIRSGNPIAAALAQSNDIQNGLSNLFAPFSPLNTMQAGLLKAQTDLATAKADVERGQLGLANRELDAKLPVYAAQAAQAKAGAVENLRHGDLYTAQTKEITRKWEAQAQLPQLATAAGLSVPEGNLFGAIVNSSGDSNANNIASALNAVGRREPIKLDQGQTALLAPADPRNPQAAEPAPSMVPQTQIPFSQGGFGLPSGYQPQGAPMLPQQGGTPAPLAVGPTGNLAGAAVRSGNVVSIPGGKTTTSNPTLLKLADEASTLGNNAYGVYRESQRLNNPEALKNSVNPLGDGMLGNALDWWQQSSGDPAAQDRLAFKNFKVNDWLTKSSKLKGAITEAEGAQLRSGQPGSQASQEVKSNWLENVGYYSKMEADWQAANQEALQSGQPRPIPTRWKEEYMAQNPQPAMAFTGSQKAKAPSSPAAGSQGDSEVVTVISKSGKEVQILKSNLKEALARGAKLK